MRDIAADGSPLTPTGEAATLVESWREDFIGHRISDDKIGELTRQIAFLLVYTERKTAEQFEDYNGKHQIACMEIDRLRYALAEIRDHWACQYDHPKKEAPMYSGPYGIGITDGHRAAADIARAALEKHVSHDHPHPVSSDGNEINDAYAAGVQIPGVTS